MHSARMLQAMRCSNGSRKLFSLPYLLGRGFLFWRGRKFLFRISLDVSLLGKQLVDAWRLHEPTATQWTDLGLAIQRD